MVSVDRQAKLRLQGIPLFILVMVEEKEEEESFVLVMTVKQVELCRTLVG